MDTKEVEKNLDWPYQFRMRLIALHSTARTLRKEANRMLPEEENEAIAIRGIARRLEGRRRRLIREQQRKDELKHGPEVERRPGGNDPEETGQPETETS